MSSLIDAERTERPRALPILIACVLGFLAGQVVATGLDLVAVRVTHYPGGMAELARSVSPPWWSNVLGLGGLWVGFAVAIFYAYSHGNLRSLPHQWRPRYGDFGYVFLGLGCQLSVDLLYRPFHFKGLDQPVHHLFNGARGLTFVVLVAMTIFVAPLMEEWFFRGVLYRAIAEGGRHPNSRRTVALGVVVSAVLFALAHGEPLQFVGLALLGVVLAVLVARTGRLIPSIVTHISFNGAAIIALIAQRAGH